MRLLAETGVYASGHERVITDGDRHGGIYLRFGGESHHIDFEDLVGASVWLYPQTDVFVDLHAARTRDGGDVRFGITDTAVHDLDADRPRVTYDDADGRGARGERRPRRGRRRLPLDLPRPRARGGSRYVRGVPVRLVRDPRARRPERPRADLHALRPRASR